MSDPSTPAQGHETPPAMDDDSSRKPEATIPDQSDEDEELTQLNQALAAIGPWQSPQYWADVARIGWSISTMFIDFGNDVFPASAVEPVVRLRLPVPSAKMLAHQLTMAVAQWESQMVTLPIHDDAIAVRATEGDDE